jgi:hypothetical protein
VALNFFADLIAIAFVANIQTEQIIQADLLRAAVDEFETRRKAFYKGMNAAMQPFFLISGSRFYFFC